jgi:hypothetical protein
LEVLIYAGEGQGGSNKLGGIVAVNMGETNNDKVQPVRMLASVYELWGERWEDLVTEIFQSLKMTQ